MNNAKSIVDNLEKWLITAEKIIENEANSSVFYSIYGKEYYEDFTDLLEIGYLFMLPKSISIFQGKLNEVKNLEQFKEIIIALLKQMIDQEKLKGKKKKQAKVIISKLDIKANETITVLKEEWKDFKKIIDELNNVTETPELEQKEEVDDIEESTVTGFVEEMKLFQRINAYFVIALYAIIDVYCLVFLQNSMSQCPKDRVYKSLQKITPPPSNPVDSLNTALDIQKTDLLNLKDIRTKLIKKLKWEVHQESFISFKDIRKVPAHQKTVLSIDEIIEKFPKQHTRAEKQFKQVLKEIDKNSLPAIIKEPLLEGIDDLRIGLCLREIGNSCLRYLVLHDAILQHHLYEIQFLTSREKIQKEKTTEIS
ncbi:MAG: hypothetical protein ACTSVO_07120 [Candidatus Heimdallarchaeaceae archaeon]